MKEMNEEKNQNMIQTPAKKEYQAPTCEQHKPLDHVRVYRDLSSQLPGI